MGQRMSMPDLHGTYQIVMLGLDNAGKSTSLYRLKLDRFVQPAPTVGFNCEKFKPSSGAAKGQTFTIWDVGGQEKLRPLWRSYIRQTDAIVFVVDSTDAERFEEAKLELHNLLRLADIPAFVPVLLLANKQDLPTAVAQDEIEQVVGVKDLGPNHTTRTLCCCAVTGEGLDDVLDALHELIQTSRKLDKGKKRQLR
uniref:Uncharacterized protein n=1 Tax=Plectus sambesii TaxID=2011161 RepID=A0A914UL36_9BILA